MLSFGKEENERHSPHQFAWPFLTGVLLEIAFGYHFACVKIPGVLTGNPEVIQ